MELTYARVALPQRLNAASVTALRQAIEVALDSDAPVVALTGYDAETFCLGLDIASGVDGTPATHAFSDLLSRLHDAPKPLMALVDGQAIGGGMGLACACDWLVATERARFALPELLWGLVPAIIWPVITDRMAPHAARQWTLSAHTRTAAEGVAAGLVDDLVAPGQIDRAAARAVRMLRRVEPAALQTLREWARASRQLGMAEALRRGADITAEMVRQPAVRRRWQSFEQGGNPWSD